MLNYNPLEPEAISTDHIGYLTSLSNSGRQACWPGTHVLLDRIEGHPDAKALTVLVDRDGELNLDLFVGEYVALSGLSELAPADCKIITNWLLDVDEVEIRELAPGF